MSPAVVNNTHYACMKHHFLRHIFVMPARKARKLQHNRQQISAGANLCCVCFTPHYTLPLPPCHQPPSDAIGLGAGMAHPRESEEWRTMTMRQRYEFFAPIWRVMRDDNMTADDVAEQVGFFRARGLVANDRRDSSHSGAPPLLLFLMSKLGKNGC